MADPRRLPRHGQQAHLPPRRRPRPDPHDQRSSCARDLRDLPGHRGLPPPRAIGPGTVRRMGPIGAVLEIDQCPQRPRTDPSVVVVPAVGISRLTEESLSAALSMGDRVVVVHVQPGTETEDRAAAPTCSGAGRNGDPTKRWYCCWASTKTGGPAGCSVRPSPATYASSPRRAPNVCCCSSARLRPTLVGAGAVRPAGRGGRPRCRPCTPPRWCAGCGSACCTGSRPPHRRPRGAPGDSSCRVGEPSRAVESTL
jgi:hypothetical protein